MYCEGTADILDAHGCWVDTHVFIYTYTPECCWFTSAARRYPVYPRAPALESLCIVVIALVQYFVQYRHRERFKNDKLSFLINLFIQRYWRLQFQTITINWVICDRDVFWD